MCQSGVVGGTESTPARMAGKSVTGAREHLAMNDPLVDLARRQHGLVSRGQVLGLLTTEQVRRRLRSGRLQSVRSGVYRIAGTPESWEQAVLAACLAVPGAAASFRCAAALWRFERFTDQVIEITVPARSRRRLEGVTVHDSSVAGPLHRATVGVVPVTSPARTLCDLTAIENWWTVERAVDEALRRKLVTLRALARVAEDLDSRGRRRCTVMREILERRAPGYHPGDSDPEKRIADLLVCAGLPAPTRQYRVRLGTRTVRIDLCYPSAKIAIEYDSWGFHKGRQAFDNDRARANELVILGFSVLRFTSQSGDQSIVDTVGAALARACVV
jgi:very-short-patch-repair endonuclease